MAAGATRVVPPPPATANPRSRLPSRLIAADRSISDYSSKHSDETISLDIDASSAATSPSPTISTSPAPAVATPAKAAPKLSRLRSWFSPQHLRRSTYHHTPSTDIYSSASQPPSPSLTRHLPARHTTSAKSRVDTSCGADGTSRTHLRRGLRVNTKDVHAPVVILEAPSPVQPTTSLADDHEPSTSPPAPSDHSKHTSSSSLKGAVEHIVDTNDRATTEIPSHVPHVNTITSDSTATTQSPLRSSLLPITMASMGIRKIWVKRPGGSATLVQIREEDLVDEVRETILRKYANSLGKSIDAPDMNLRIVQRIEHAGPRPERLLGPEEDMCKALDTYYPGGQTVDEALIVDVPPRKTPRVSPKVYHHQTSYHALDDYRPLENGTDYFPPMPAIIPQSIPQTAGSHDSRVSQHHLPPGADHPRSMSVLNTGSIPPVPSPGGRRRHGEHRPRFNRNHTSSPTVVTHNNTSAAIANPPTNIPSRVPGRHRVDSSASETLHVPANVAPAPLPTPPVLDASVTKPGSTPPTPSSAAILPHRHARPRKHRKPISDRPPGRSHHKNSSSTSNINLVASILDGSVPPINVLIVEDNVINLRILENFMKRLKVRWQTAVNGQIGVNKWKSGGFHLVLMDIQMPVMNGLQATKEIRRLERVNGIGVFSSTDDVSANESDEAGLKDDQDKTKDSDSDQLQVAEGLFKSPVIIVALTASSLQSDRHEALTAGCNDFLTKPVDWVWLERKVKEWGCMQALIDFDGWRKWKDYAAQEDTSKGEKKKTGQQRGQAERKKREAVANGEKATTAAIPPSDKTPEKATAVNGAVAVTAATPAIQA